MGKIGKQYHGTEIVREEKFGSYIRFPTSNFTPARPIRSPQPLPKASLSLNRSRSFLRRPTPPSPPVGRQRYLRPTERGSTRIFLALDHLDMKMKRRVAIAAGKLI